MKFWQKNYILTLLLFAIFISGSFFALFYITENNSYNTECDRRLAQQHSIAQLLSNDAASVAQRRPEALPSLAKTYADNYLSDGIFIKITSDDEVWANRLPQNSPDIIPPEIGERAHALYYVNEKPYLYVTARLPQPDTMVLTCAFDLSEYFDSTNTLRRTGIITAVAAVLLLAVVLYFLLRGLSRPTERLAVLTKRFADGDYSARSHLKSRDEVGQLALAFNTLAQNVQENIGVLEQTAQDKQNLVDTLSHEIRTPLTAVEGYAQYLLHASVTEEERYESLTYIIEESRRLSGMCDSLLQMASLREEKAERHNVDLNNVIKKAHRTVAAKRHKSRVRILSFDGEHSVVKGEEVLLESLLINLMDNAVKACSQGDTVSVYTTYHDGATRLVVKDNGCGMTKEQLSHLGEQFYRPDKARSRKHGGAGLGIALCFEIARSHDAHIHYSSAPQQGTVVTVTFTT